MDKMFVLTPSFVYPAAIVADALGILRQAIESGFQGFRAYT
jgi:hypothetical protein